MSHPLISVGSCAMPCARRMRPVHFHHETIAGTISSAPSVVARTESHGLLFASFSSLIDAAVVAELAVDPVVPDLRVDEEAEGQEDEEHHQPDVAHLDLGAVSIDLLARHRARVYPRSGAAATASRNRSSSCRARRRRRAARPSPRAGRRARAGRRGRGSSSRSRNWRMTATSASPKPPMSTGPAVGGAAGPPPRACAASAVCRAARRRRGRPLLVLTGPLPTIDRARRDVAEPLVLAW